ncbi:hypothetical protein INN71_11815 [Nocardioides sp. ChNu-153]|uniref:hypothetical protein n=1 Tax=Nocardioides sp. ChNu-153 TaxID=2779364 RepID=UPI00264DFF81|nr:hypothetical protein [Nocardioides sp. ChNu-153]MDN7122075.1 hypothetical protein [Nocardioides sp. ChNu-153]
MSEIQARSGHVSRRAVTRAAVWSVPTVAVVAAAPAFAASAVDVGAFSITGTCGTLGLVNVGFDLTAGPQDLPAGTTVTIAQFGVNLGALGTQPGGIATVTPGSSTTSVQLVAPLPAGTTLSLRSTVNVSALWSADAVVNLPSGFTATGAKTTGGIGGTAVACSAT